MKQKVILISIDGMRPDGFLQCGNPFIHDMTTNTYVPMVRPISGLFEQIKYAEGKSIVKEEN